MTTARPQAGDTRKRTESTTRTKGLCSARASVVERVDSRRSGAGSVVTARAIPPASARVGVWTAGASPPRAAVAPGSLTVTTASPRIVRPPSIRRDDEAPRARLVDRECRNVRDVLHSGWLDGGRRHHRAERRPCHRRELDGRVKARVGEPAPADGQGEDDRPGWAGPDRRRDDLHAKGSRGRYRCRR